MHDDEHSTDDVGEPDVGEPDDVEQPDDEWEDVDGGEEADWSPDGPAGGLAAATLVGTFVGGVVTGLVLVLVWGAFTGEDRTGSAEGSRADLAGITAGEDDGPADASAASPARPVATRLSRCVHASRALERSLRAAQPALDQWRVHVDAMNKLVVGEITLQQASDFWERTRVGAQRRVRAHRDAMSSLDRRGVDCPRPEFLAAGARALPACARKVDAQVRAVEAATTSVDMWDQHVRHMDMLRLGDLSPEDATQMWLSMWREGVRELDAYQLAAGRAAQLDDCRA